MKETLPEGIRAMLAVFEQAGAEAWLVGGCVRDSLMDRVPKDYDIAAGILPEQVQALFEKTAPTGLRYGTVTVFFRGAQAEVTTFRSESGTRDARHPEVLRFGTSLREDLSRRDFTVNAMAWHPHKGLCDPFHGAYDLRARLIRAVGDPRRRFAEDALRILRCWRFAAELDFSVEPETCRAAENALPSVSKLSGERVRGEWEKLLCSPHPETAFRPELTGVWPALGFAPAKRTHFSENKAAWAAFPKDPAARWAAFLFLAGLDAENFFIRLRFSNRLAEKIRLFLSFLSAGLPADAPALKRALGRFPPALLDEALALRAALLGENTDAPRTLLRRILARKEPYLIGHLALRGDEIAALGFTGAACGKAQRAALEYVIERPEANTPDDLRRFLLKKRTAH